MAAQKQQHEAELKDLYSQMQHLMETNTLRLREFVEDLKAQAQLNHQMKQQQMQLEFEVEEKNATIENLQVEIDRLSSASSKSDFKGFDFPKE